MVSNSIVILRDLKTVWGKIEGEFCKTFNCKAKDLHGKKIKVQAKNYSGNPIDIFQVVKEYNPEKSITIESNNNNDIVTSVYKTEVIDASATRVILSVEGKNQGSVLKTWNYWLMGLPVLRGGTKKRLGLQLRRLKVIIEEGDEAV